MTKLVLTHYYDSLPKLSAPKTNFVREVANKCNVVEATVRLWIKGDTKPSDEKHLKILSEITGIPTNKLFEENED
jgi:hypothetical protein